MARSIVGLPPQPSPNYRQDGPDVRIQDGGTAASDVVTARRNLGVPGKDVAETITGVWTFSTPPVFGSGSFTGDITFGTNGSNNKVIGKNDSDYSLVSNDGVTIIDLFSKDNNDDVYFGSTAVKAAQPNPSVFMQAGAKAGLRMRKESASAVRFVLGDLTVSPGPLFHLYPTEDAIALKVRAFTAGAGNMIEIFDNANVRSMYWEPTGRLLTKATAIRIVDPTDGSKTINFQASGATANADLTLAWVGTVDRIVTVPDGGGAYTLAGLQVAQSWSATNTFTVAPKIDVVNATTGYVWTATDADGNGDWQAAGAGTVDSARTWSTLQKFKDTTILIGDDADITKAFVWSLGGATTAKTMTFVSSHTLDRSITLPDATTTLAGLDVSEVFTNTQDIAPYTGGTDRIGFTLTGNSTKLENLLQQRDEFGNIIWAVSPGGGSVYLSSFLAIASSSTVNIGRYSDSLFNSAALAGSAFTAFRIITIPDITGTLMLLQGTQTVVGTKTHPVGTILLSSTISSGTSFRDTTDQTKRARMILSTATTATEHALRFNGTLGRTYDLPNYSGFVPVPVNEGTSGQVLTSAGAGAQQTWVTPSSGGVTVGTATIDFGATPAAEASIAVTGQASITAASHVDAYFMHETNDEEQGSFFLRLNCGTLVAGTGFTIYAETLGALITGTLTVHWRWT